MGWAASSAATPAADKAVTRRSRRASLQPDRVVELGDEGRVRRQLLGRRCVGAGRADGAGDHLAGSALARLDQAQPDLPAADQVQIDLGQQLAVEQGAVPGARRVVDARSGGTARPGCWARRGSGAGPGTACRSRGRARTARGRAGSSSALRKRRSNAALWMTSRLSPRNSSSGVDHLGEARDSRAGTRRSGRARGTPPRACRARGRGSCGRCGRSADGRSARCRPPRPGGGPARGRGRWSRCRGRSRAAWLGSQVPRL